MLSPSPAVVVEFECCGFVAVVVDTDEPWYQQDGNRPPTWPCPAGCGTRRYRFTTRPSGECASCHGVPGAHTIPS